MGRRPRGSGSRRLPVPRARLTRKTTGNSSPFEAWTVIRFTASSASIAALASSPTARRSRCAAIRPASRSRGSGCGASANGSSSGSPGLVKPRTAQLERVGRLSQDEIDQFGRRHPIDELQPPAGRRAGLNERTHVGLGELRPSLTAEWRPAARSTSRARADAAPRRRARTTATA